MEGITNRRIAQDLESIRNMLNDYGGAIWCRQEGNPADYDHQMKLVRIAMCDVRTGLYLAQEALRKLNEIGVIEDMEEQR
jgi:hypothetical protein